MSAAPSKLPAADVNAMASADAGAAVAKQDRLFAVLASLDSLLIAFSGGADSAYLAWAAHTVLGSKALAVTALSASYSGHDREQALAFVAVTGIRHEFIETHEFDNPQYVANQGDRCYHCKDELFARMETLRTARGFASIAYGINADDTRDFRPGHRAAHEHAILAPLLDAQLSKAEIRLLSHAAALPTWDRPASACLSSRVPYGTAVTPELLSQLDRSESVLRLCGFRQFRVRAHGNLARIEIAREELARALDPATSAQISAGLKEAGFTFVTLDLEGYRSGSLNILLKA